MAVKDVDEYIEIHKYWQTELKQIRQMLQDTKLEETIKWGAPTYTLKDKNVAGLAAFKNHIALWFFNGDLLKQNTDLLLNAQEGKTKSLRQIRFEKGDEINTEVLLRYVLEAIENQKLKKTIKASRKQELIIPSELRAALKKDADLDESYCQLTSGKQREYADYINDAKREATRINRLKKIIPMIKKGVGLHDKYKNC